ncbi:MAG TPA: PAS domain-containing protein [Ktedonobacterales bacterium]|nr:PAS domain-containing protein [Ktedonobacterales bacterium]
MNESGDSSQRQSSDDAARDGAEHTQAILEATPVSMIVVRLRDWTILHANGHIGDLSGYRVEDLVGQPVPNFFVHPEDGWRLLAALQRDGFVRGAEAEFQRSDGSSFWGVVTMQYVTLNDELVLVAGYIDITEQKRAEMVLRAYVENVAVVTAAAAAVEVGTFAPQTLDGVAARDDDLGQLARVFQRMAREVQAREHLLHQQVQQLRIEIDQTKKQRAVAEITESEYFQQVQQRAADLRKRAR